MDSKLSKEIEQHMSRLPKSREEHEMQQPLWETTNDISPHQKAWEKKHPVKPIKQKRKPF